MNMSSLSQNTCFESEWYICADCFRRGFVVKASEQALDTIHTLSQKYAPIVEEDKTVTIQDQG